MVRTSRDQIIIHAMRDESSLMMFVWKTMRKDVIHVHESYQCQISHMCACRVTETSAGSRKIMVKCEHRVCQWEVSPF